MSEFEEYNDKVWRVYALVDPDDLTIGYIGVSSQSLDKRLNQHISEVANGKGGARKHEWLSDIMDSGAYPIIVELDQCSEWEWPEREQFWVSLLRSRGYELTNTSDGGIGNPGVVKSEEVREKISASMKEYKSTIH